MINRAALLILLSGVFYTSISVAASGSAFGPVGEVVAGAPATGVAAQELMYFKVAGAVHSECAVAGREHFVIKNDDGGRTMVALLLAAKMADKKVHVAGRGTCSYMPGFEDVSYIYID